MKIYLAGPIRDMPDYNFPAFNQAAKRLRELGHEVFSPAEKGEEVDLVDTPELQNDLRFRRKVFKLDTTYICDQADAVALLPGWEKSKGANAEYTLALALGITIMILGTEFVS